MYENAVDAALMNVVLNHVHNHASHVENPALGFVRITSAKIYVEKYATAFSVKLPVPRSLGVATRALACAGKIVPQSVVFAMLKPFLQ